MPLLHSSFTDNRQPSCSPLNLYTGVIEFSNYLVMIATRFMTAKLVVLVIYRVCMQVITFVSRLCDGVLGITIMTCTPM